MSGLPSRAESPPVTNLPGASTLRTSEKFGNTLLDEFGGGGGGMVCSSFSEERRIFYNFVQKIIPKFE